MSHPTRILLAEDDPSLGVLLEEYLQLKGYTVRRCENGAIAWDVFQQERKAFDIGILDIMMPVMDGFTLAENIRQIDSDFPIVFLTAKNMQEDVLKGFKLGADDYLTKPFSMDELQARVDAVMRRTFSRRSSDQSQFTIGIFKFDSKLQQLTWAGNTQQLTTKESQLLKMLAERLNDVLERSDALNEIWEKDDYFTARSMDVYITKLRKYLRPDPDLQIKNIHGKGYRLLDASAREAEAGSAS